MHVINKYFSAVYDTLLDKDLACYSNIIFLQDIGPFKSGDTFPTGYIVVDLTRSKLQFEMNTELEPKGPCPLNFKYEIDLFALT